MTTVSVRCNHCGAPLDVAENTRFVTCTFCNSQLEVKRTENSVFTEEVARIARNTDRMAESLEVIKLQNEIEQLDREWDSVRGGYESKRRGKGPPSRAGAAVGLLFAVFFAIVCFSMAGMASNTGAPGIFQMVPIGMGFFALIAAVMGTVNSTKYQTNRSAYQNRRDELVSRLDAMKRDED